MADIELVIKIDEYYIIIKGFNGEKIGAIVDAIKNGKLIPKGYGELSNANEDNTSAWYDIPTNEMTESQLRIAVKELRKKLAEVMT